MTNQANKGNNKITELRTYFSPINYVDRNMLFVHYIAGCKILKDIFLKLQTSNLHKSLKINFLKSKI
jgi:hypothetical protein